MNSNSSLRKRRLNSIKNFVFYTAVLTATLFFNNNLKAQNVLISDDSTYVPKSSAILDIKALNKGLLIPRVALTSTSSALPITSPDSSLMVYNKATAGDVIPGYYFWNGGKWVLLSSSSGIYTQGSVPFAGPEGLLMQNNSKLFWDNTNYRLGIGTSSPTASLHLPAGTTSAGSSPLKFSEGPLMTTVEPGAMEYKGHTLYFTTYLVRRSVMLAQDVVVTPVTVANTTTETTIYTSTMAADYLTPGKLINIKLYGRFLTNGTSNIYTIRVKLAGATILTVASTSQATTGSTGRPFDIDIRSTVRSIGSSGTIISYGKTQQDNLTPNIEISELTTINTTISNTLTVTLQWNSSSSNNTITLEGGATECVDASN